jgi:hypothetical protein
MDNVPNYVSYASGLGTRGSVMVKDLYYKLKGHGFEV